MRNLKKRFGFLMAVIMVLCACMIGCSGKKDAGIAGKYVAEFDALDIMNSSMEASGISLKTSIITEFDLELKEDGTYTFDLNADAFKESIIAGISADIDDIIGSLVASLGASGTDVEDLAKQAGYESYDAFKQAMVDEISASFDDATMQDMKDSAHGEGSYEVKDKDVTLTAKDGDAVDALKINDDGSLTANVIFENSDITLTFVKQ